MNIIHKVTLRHMLMHRKRTMVTICGAIISVAMMIAVSTFGYSMLDMMQQNVANMNGGYWHAVFYNLDDTKDAALQETIATDFSMHTRVDGYAMVDETSLEFPYVYVQQFDEEAFQNFRIELLEGRLPSAPDEIIVSRSKMSNVRWQIGDEVELAVGTRMLDDAIQGSYTSYEKKEQLNITNTLKLRVVGIMKEPAFISVNTPGFVALRAFDTASNQPFHTYTALKNFTKSSYNTLYEFVQDNAITDWELNSELLYYYGFTANETLAAINFTLTILFLGIIMLGAVSLIFNSFSISLSERTKELGLLSSIGATKQQKRSAIFFEGFIIALCSIPLGIFFGLLGLQITFWCTQPLIATFTFEGATLRICLEPLSVILTVVFAILTIAIASVRIAKKASAITPIEAIRQNKDIKVRKGILRTSWLIQKLFGIEGIMAAKTIKRNPTRYRVSVFSLTVSIIIFISISSMMGYMKYSYFLTQRSVKYDYVLYESLDEPFIVNSLMKEILLHEEVKQGAHLQFLDGMLKIDQNKISPIVKEHFGVTEIYGNIMTMEGASLSAYLQSIRVNEKAFDENRQVIVFDQIVFREWGTGQRRQINVIQDHALSKLSLHVYDMVQENYSPFTDVDHVMFSNTLPLGVDVQDTPHISILVGPTLWKELLEAYSGKTVVSAKTALLGKDQAVLLEHLDTIISTNQDIFMYDYYDDRVKTTSLQLLIQIFTYGFVVLIALVCLTNVYNTMHTSVQMRRQEFAILKSVGMAQKSIEKMLLYESMQYAWKSLLFGLPTGFVVSVYVYSVLRGMFDFYFYVPLAYYGGTVIVVFMFTTLLMRHASRSLHTKSIVQAIKEEHV